MNEERLIYLLLAAIGGPVAVIAFARGGAVGSGETIAGLLALVGIAGLFGTRKRPPSLAEARVENAPLQTREDRGKLRSVPPGAPSTGTPLSAYVVAVAAVAFASAIGVAAAPYASHADQAMAYLLAILIAALGGRGPGLTAAVLSAACFDFFFVEPRYTFAVADAHFLVTFAVMVAIGIAIGGLVTRSRRAEAESHARELRARSEELRATLLSSVSHDLRTPVAIINGIATRQREHTEGETAQAMQAIVDEAERLSRILTNLLSITKVESGAAPKREWVPLDELVGSALGRLEPQLAGRAVKLEVADELAHVDPLLTEQLLVNLVDNAIKHTHATCPIEVRAHRDATGAVVEVDDRGPGLPPGPPEQVFEKFYRGERAKAGGVGLGLAVCRGIAVAHGGAIEAASRPGGGATFRVHFPDNGPPPALLPAGDPP